MSLGTLYSNTLNMKLCLKSPKVLLMALDIKNEAAWLNITLNQYISFNPKKNGLVSCMLCNHI